MRLHRLKIKQLRQFRQPFELTALDPGLNLFSGPNEAGKSTLVTCTPRGVLRAPSVNQR